MNKVKMFFVAAALVLTTAGVFAGKAKFTTASSLYYYTGTPNTYVLISTTIDGSVFSYGGSGQAKVTSSGGVVTRNLVTHNGSTYVPVQTTF